MNGIKRQLMERALDRRFFTPQDVRLAVRNAVPFPILRRSVESLMSDAHLPEEHGPAQQETQNAPTALVGIGGSAGALDGYERFFLSMPPDSGMAFVVVPHLDPRHSGLMPEILQRCTSMPVVAVTDGMLARPDHVHVIPPNCSLSVMNGALLLDDLEQAGGMAIDAFFESLALDQGERAVGVVLSGMGSDGTRGVQAIKEHFGLVLVQDPETAEYPAMPRSAAATQLANDVLPAEELAPRLYGFVTRRSQMRSCWAGTGKWARRCKRFCAWCACVPATTFRATSATRWCGALTAA